MSTQVVRAACPHDCPDTCGMLVTVTDGVAVKIQGDPSMPFTEGTLCTKVAHYLERTYSPERVLHPLRRTGKKGAGNFRRVSWDEALDEIATRLQRIAAEDPQMILPCSYAGTMGMLQYSSIDRRFFHRLGASLLDRTLCSSAGKAGLKATLGGNYGMDPEQFVDSRLIVIWGSNPIVSNLHFWSRAQEAKRRGAKLIAIDPYRSLTAEKCSQHIAPYPGTDAALALGMMHVLIAEDLLDRDYIASYTIGFDALKKRVLLVDDEARVRASLKAVLEPNYEVIQAADAQEGLDLFHKEAPHVVLLDVILPGTDGLSVLQTLRTEQNTTPVIMLTGTKSVKTAVDAMKLGAADYLSKPFDVEALLETLDSIQRS